jgi:hypothetical protein
MRTRSLENRVFSVTANRTGTEKRGNIALTFTGKSQIVNPKGDVLATASERSESLKVVEVDPAEALDKNVTPNNDLFRDRKVTLYKAILRKVVLIPKKQRGAAVVRANCTWTGSRGGADRTAIRFPTNALRRVPACRHPRLAGIFLA